MKNIITVNSEQAKSAITKVLQANLVPVLTASPGVGKSDIARSIAKSMNLYLIDIRLGQCEPSDLNGIPNFIKDKTRVEFIPNAMFPLEDDELPMNEETKMPYDGWLIFFDELLDAPLPVQSASYKVILDRYIGNRKLHPNVRIMGAGNRVEDNACAQEVSSALKSRMVWFELALSAEKWIAWAKGSNINHSVISFLQYKDSYLSTFNPDDTDNFTYACPRTWENMSNLMKQYTEYGSHEFRATACGTIGSAYVDFMSFLSSFSDLPSLEQIVANPSGCKLVKDGEMFALKAMFIKWATKETIQPLVEYVKRMPKEMQLVYFYDLRSYKHGLIMQPSVSGWARDIGVDLNAKIEDLA